MIRIAVCDDIKEELSEITEHIEAFAGSKDLTDTIDVTAYDSSSALMDDAGYARGRGHGIGVKSMSSFARDNGGTLDFSQDNGRFTIRLLV